MSQRFRFRRLAFVLVLAVVLLAGYYGSYRYSRTTLAVCAFGPGSAAGGGSAEYVIMDYAWLTDSSMVQYWLGWFHSPLITVDRFFHPGHQFEFR
jgi:hypothetical protein